MVWEEIIRVLYFIFDNFVREFFAGMEAFGL
jgi:hypothetical protein